MRIKKAADFIEGGRLFLLSGTRAFSTGFHETVQGYGNSTTGALRFWIILRLVTLLALVSYNIELIGVSE